MVNGHVPGTSVKDGEHCPCCGQLVKLYRRSLSNAPARWMIKLYLHDGNEGREYVYMPEVLNTMRGTPSQGGYGNLGQYWDLTDRMPGIRSDGSNRVGWWRLTDDGREFVLDHLTVPKYAYVYNSKLFDFDGPEWSIRDALGTKFDYNDLMNG